MKKIVIALSILLCAGFTLSAMNMKADDIQIGEISSDAALGGISLSLGSGKAEVTESASGVYVHALTISGDTAISGDLHSGETLSIIGAAPEEGAFEVMITSPDGVTEVAAGEQTADGTSLAEYTIGSDGVYTISSPSGSAVSIYQIYTE